MERSAGICRNGNKMTEARRRASQAYKERQEREGIKVVSVRLSHADRKVLKWLAQEHDLSQSGVVTLLLQNVEIG